MIACRTVASYLRGGGEHIPPDTAQFFLTMQRKDVDYVIRRQFCNIEVFRRFIIGIRSNGPANLRR